MSNKKSTLIYRDEEIVGQCDCCGSGNLFPDCQGNGRVWTWVDQDPCGASIYDYSNCERMRKVSQQEVVQIIASLSDEERNAIINKLTWAEEDIKRSVQWAKDNIKECQERVKKSKENIKKAQKKCKHRLTERFRSADPGEENYDVCKICDTKIDISL